MSLRTPTAGVLLLIAGCSSVPADRAELEQLRADYEAVSAVPEIRRHAPVALHEANLAIGSANAARTPDEYHHQLYRARRQLELAQAITNRELAEIEVQMLSRQRDLLRQANRQREATRAEQRARELQAELAALETRRTDRGVQITLDEVLFRAGRADLAGAANETLDALATFLKEHADRKVLIEAHTDASGSQDYNQFLSERRAEAVRKAIVARGVEADRLTARGYGEIRPIASNDTEAGRQLNRRVEIVILRDGLQP